MLCAAGTLLLSAGMLITSCSEPPPPALVSAPSGLVLRSEPTTTSSKLEVLPFGTAVEVVQMDGPRETIGGKTAPWYKIKHGEQEGWVFSAFLATDPVAVAEVRSQKECRDAGGQYVDEQCLQPWMVTWLRGSSGFSQDGCAAFQRLNMDGTVWYQNGYCPPADSPYGTGAVTMDGNGFVQAGTWSVDGNRIAVTITTSYVSDSCDGSILAGPESEYFIEKLDAAEVPEFIRRNYGTIVPRDSNGRILLPEGPTC